MSEKRYKEEEKLTERYGRDGGWTVPEGFFSTFEQEMMDQLPSYPETPRPVKMTTWRRIQPYVYLAAMFAGIWLMMQVFIKVSGDNRINPENPPALIAQIMNTSDIKEVMYIPDDVMSDVELEQEVTDSFQSMTDFEAAFYAAGMEESDRVSEEDDEYIEEIE